jgi:hypothetical protein
MFGYVYKFNQCTYTVHHKIHSLYSWVLLIFNLSSPPQLQDGNSMLLFAEGTRSPDGKLHRLVGVLCSFSYYLCAFVGWIILWLFMFTL